MNKPEAIPLSKPNDGLYARRQKIHVRAVAGLFNNLRWLMVLLTQAVFYGLVWFDWNDRQAVLFHLVERKFYIFGMVFWPQDVIYLAVMLIVGAYGLFLVTTIAGRIFCGYACPQTVYTEVFMWIEQLVEGNRAQRLKLDQAPLSVAKLARRGAKHALWLILALWTSFTFVGYFTPMSELKHNLMTNTLGSWETFWIFFYAGFTYLMAGFMREQVCKYMCPYARFQSVMFDPDTLIITYDEERGEPRGARKRGSTSAEQGLGSCIDCGICVQVCPTGIDIRNGLQYECIGCAACVDGCNEVMDKIGAPRGLVRYSTENAMAQKLDTHGIRQHILRPRVVLYSTILLLIISAAGWFLAHHIPLKVDVLRDRSVLSRELDDGRIENVYSLRLMNADEHPHTYRLQVSGLPKIDLEGSGEVTVPAASMITANFSVRVPPDAGEPGAHQIFFDIAATDNADIKRHEKASFQMPR
jgi:cytochrome c oxidase accessory protein FixG